MEEGYLFPYLVYTVPNALFPLMTLFIRMNLERYKPYIGLYTAGKIIAVVSFLAWFVLCFGTIKNFVPADMADLILLGGVLLLTIGDVLSIAGACALIFRLNRFDVESKKNTDRAADSRAVLKEYPASGQGDM
jgi:hypothetical protein